MTNLDVKVTPLKAAGRSSDPGPWVITIGNFDGVHLGHRALLSAAVQMAQGLSARTLVYTFQPHPAQVLAPQQPFYRLFDFQDQVESFRELGIDQLRVIPFTPEFAKIEATEFYKKYILGIGQVLGLCVGHDFHFGHQRQGDLVFLHQACSQQGMLFKAIEPFQFEGHVVSSRRIREFLLLGDLQSAEKLLGRKYYLRGKVIPGAQRGRTLGFPTANLQLADELAKNLSLRRGVYVSKVIQADGGVHFGVTNVGLNPTVTETLSVKIETHIFNYSGDNYGSELKLELLKFLRPEKKFSDLEALKTQIREDVHQGQEWLSRGEYGT